jgi:uncharacterized cupredoxin-like copper-binding protein
VKTESLGHAYHCSMKHVPLLTAVIVVVAASGCGGGSSGSTSTQSTSSQAAGGAVVQTIKIQEKEYRLTPSAVKVSKPGTYVFEGVNKGTISHALAISGAGISQSSSPVAPGQTTMLKVTLTKAGQYQIYCPIDGHKNMGMRGTVTLGSGGANGSTGSAPTATTSTSTTSGGSGSTGY